MSTQACHSCGDGNGRHEGFVLLDASERPVRLPKAWTER